MEAEAMPHVVFHCGMMARRRTSWTDDNPGRRFYCCLRAGAGRCNFWTWDDPPMCPRARVVIPGLLRNMNAKEAEIRELKSNMKKLKIVVIFLSLVYAILLWKVMV